MDLVLIRHPAPAVEAGICYGASDLPLAGEATVEAAAIAARLRAAQVDWPKAILASPLQRCAAVAQAIGVLAARPVRLDARLREIDFGTWEMRRWDEIGAAALDRWQSDLMGAREHGGESAAQFVARVESFALSFAASLPEDASAILVTHAGVIRALASLWLDVPLDSLLTRAIAYGGLVRFSRDARGWQLIQWDETLG
ncbi:alpha-ribazole phosphatase [Burkholderia gladioli]|uniref:alpha-ribazole phosphatase n=1 Tax=Burkholderia gladioli TaxID=28095 RepID=UPI002FE402C2